MVANIFGSSPVEPLEQHVDTVYQCASQLPLLVSSAIDGAWDKASEYRDEIRRLERQADEQMIAIRKQLARNLFMPVRRDDLLGLLMEQDLMANRAEAVADILVARRAAIPAAIAADYRRFVQHVVEAAALARKSVRELDELFTTGFRGAEAKLVETMIDELNALETQAGDQAAALRSGLFALESELPPVNVMFLYRIVELTEEIARRAERVGRRLEVLLAR